jgi:tetratricopeptide (TPR) repeat protein
MPTSTTATVGPPGASHPLEREVRCGLPNADLAEAIMAVFTNDELYGPCPCGSGKKLKFCCRDAITRRSPAAEARVIDEALLEMNEGRFERVEALLLPFAETSTSPSLHILLAEARFVLGHIDDGIARLRLVVDRLAPGYHYANAVLAHLLLLRGEREAATPIIDRLMQVRTRRGADIHVLLAPLALLGRDVELLELVEGAERPLEPALLISGGLAAWNLQRRESLRRLADELAHTRDGTASIARWLQRAAAGHVVISPWPKVLACDPAAVIPAGAFDRVLQRIEDAPGPADRGWSEVLRGVDRLFFVLSLAEGNPETARQACALFARLDPVVAREELQTIWESAIVPPDVARIAAQVALEHGLIENDATLHMHIDGVRQPVQVRTQSIGGDRDVVEAVYALPPRLDGLQVKALAASKEGRLPEALRGFEAILAEMPTHPASLFNRLVTLAQMGRCTVDAQLEGLRQILEQAPRYLVARTTWAALLLQERRVDEAAAVLDERHLVDAADPAGHGSAAVVLARIAGHRGDLAAARRLATMARALLGSGDFTARAPDLATLLTAGDMDRSAGQRRDRKRRSQLQRAVAADAPTAAWFEHLTAAELKEALRFHGYRLTGSPRRAQVLAELVDRVEAGGAVDVLKALQRVGGDAIVRALVEAGGHLPWDVVAHRFQPIEDGTARPDALEAVLASGLAVIVALDGLPSLALPPAARRALGVPSPSSSPATATATSGSTKAGGRWQVATMALPPIGPERPLLVFVLDVDAGQILEGYVHPQVEPALAVTIAIGRVLAKAATRPTSVEVDDDVLTLAVRSMLSGVVVEVGGCDEARAALTGALEALQEEAVDSSERAKQETWAARGVPLSLARRFHDAAAVLYRLRPWDIVPDDGCALVLDSDDGLLRECVVVVIGQAGVSFGVLIHHSLLEWRRARRAEHDRQPDALPSRLAVEFNGPDGVPAPLLDEIKRQKLPLAGPVAIPWFMAFGEGGSFAMATVDDTRRGLLVMQTLGALLAGPTASSWRRWRHREPLPTHVVVDGVTVRVGFSTAVA